MSSRTYPIASYPDSVWDGLSFNRQHPGAFVDPGPSDYLRSINETIAIQNHLDSMIYKNGDGIVRFKVPVFDNLSVPINSVKLHATKTPDFVDFKGGSVLAFADQSVEGNEEVVNFILQMPHNWVEGSDVDFNVQWAVSSAVEANVVWKFTYSWANEDSVFPAETAITKISSTGGGSDKLIRAPFTSISGTGKEYSSILICSLSRNSSNAADTLTGVDTLAIQIDLHYQIDKLGEHIEGH